MPSLDALSSGLLNIELGTDDSTELFTTSRRQRAVVRGMVEFARLTGCFVRISTLTCSNGVADYDLHSSGHLADRDFMQMGRGGPEYRLISSNSTVSGSTTHTGGDDFLQTSVQRLSQEVPGWRASTGATAPEAWYLEPVGSHLYLGLYPPPTITSSQTGLLRVPYVARPSTIFSSGICPWAVNSTARSDLRAYDPAVTHYAAAQLEKLRKDWTTSDRQLQLFLGYVTAYFQANHPVSGRRIRQARMPFRQASRTRERVTDPRR